MNIKIHDGDLKIMNILWEHGSISAKRVVELLPEWNKNTIYTLLKRLVERGAVRRTDPGFICEPLLSRASVLDMEVRSLADKVADGSAVTLMSNFMSKNNLSQDDIAALERSLDMARRRLEDT